MFEEAGVFLENDNKNCVRVDGVAGLSRLWQQHLTRIPNVTLEVAEAIMSEYPCPKALFEVKILKIKLLFFSYKIIIINYFKFFGVYRLMKEHKNLLNF